MSSSDYDYKLSFGHSYRLLSPGGKKKKDLKGYDADDDYDGSSQWPEARGLVTPYVTRASYRL